MAWNQGFTSDPYFLQKPKTTPAPQAPAPQAAPQPAPQAPPPPAAPQFAGTPDQWQGSGWSRFDQPADFQSSGNWYDDLATWQRQNLSGPIAQGGQALYQGAYENFASQPWQQMTPDALYAAATGTMSQDWERAQSQNRANLEAAGLGSSGAGYAEGTPYDLTNQNYANAMAQAALQANVQAPIAQQQLFQQAYNPLASMWGNSLNQYNMYTQSLVNKDQATQDRNLQYYGINTGQSAANDAATNSMWGGLGQGLLSAGGALAGFALAPMTGGASMAIPGILNYGLSQGGPLNSTSKTGGGQVNSSMFSGMPW